MGCDVHIWLEQGFTNDEGELHWMGRAKLWPGRNYRLFALLAQVRQFHFFGPTPEHFNSVLQKHGITSEADLDKLTDTETKVISAELHDTGITMGQASFEPRGVPRDISYHVAGEYTLMVSDGNEREPGTCSRKSAEAWVASGASKVWKRELDTEGNEKPDGPLYVVSDPDNHTGSWLSTSEVAELVVRFEAAQEACIPDARAQQEHMREMFSGFRKDKIEKGEIQPDDLAARDVKVARMLDWSRFNPMLDHQLEYMRGVLAMMQVWEKDRAPCRIVFWFDN